VPSQKNTTIMTRIFVRPCIGIVCNVLTVLLLTICSFGSALAQQWETVKIYDFSDPAFDNQLQGVNGFQSNFYTLGYNGATGVNDPCAVGSSNLSGYIAMQQPLETGRNYRLSVNAKTTNSSYQLGFYYGTFPNAQLGTPIDNSVLISGVSAVTDPGNDYVSSTFTVGIDGIYWLIVKNQSGGSVILDNFALQREVTTAPPPTFSLSTQESTSIITEIEIAAGSNRVVCLTPDSALSSPLTVDVSINGDEMPHFPNYTESLAFPAGEPEPQCFTLSPTADTTSKNYNFEMALSDNLTTGATANSRSLNPQVIANLMVAVADCPSVAGPDRTICAGESVQLGTGCLPAPHPVDGVEYCYAWEPNENLFTHLSSSMPTAFPTETTTYTVYVTDSNGDLIAEDQVTVNVNSIEIEEWAMPRICPGESVTIAPVILSDGNYSYLWENGATTPTVEVELLYYTNFGLRITDEDTGCEEQFEFPVFVERPPDIEIISTYPEICELADLPGLKDENPVSRSSNECPQTSTNLYAGTGIPGYSYEWSTGETTDKITVDEAGFYWVTVTKDGEACSATDVYEVGSCATAEIQIGEDIAGNPILNAGGEPGSTYEWHDGSTAQTIEITGPGLYAVTVTSSEGCVAKDGYIVKGYEYDPEDIFLVYYTQWGNGNNVDIYIQHNLQQGQDKIEYQEVIRKQVAKKFGGDLSQKSIRFFWNKKVEHQADITPVVRGSGKFFPMIIYEWPGTNYKDRYEVFLTPTNESKPYKVKLDISHEEPNEATAQEAEVILDYAAANNMTFELGSPDFPLGYESLGQYVTAKLSVGKDAADGQSIEFDDPTLTMEIEFEPSVADPEAHDYKLYLNDTSSPEEYTVDVGSPVTLRIKDETTGEFIKPTDGIYADFAWKENGMSTTFNFDQTDGIYDFTATPSMSGTSVVVNVKFQEMATNRTITFQVTMNVVGMESGEPGIYVELSEGLGEDMSPCPGQPCEGGGYKTPRDYVDEALAQLRGDTEYPIYGDILSQIEQEGFRLVINLSTSREECELERGSGAGIRYADSAFPSLDLSGTLKIGEVETWEGNVPPCNGYDDCPKFAKLLVKISFAERGEIEDLIDNNQLDDESEIITKITQSFPQIGAELSQWIDIVDNDGEKDKAIKDLNEYFEADKLAYELTEANLPDHPSLLTISDEKLMVINLFVKALSFVPSYTTLSQIGLSSGLSNADIWTYYSGDPDCFKIQEARQKKYKQSLAHELLHLDYRKTNRVNFARWQFIRNKYDEDYPGERHLIDNCSPGNDSQCNPSGSCTSFEAGHELGNDDGTHACQAEVHYPNPEIQID